MESPFKTPPSMKYKVLQYNMDTPNCQELQNNFESLTITKPIKPSHSLNNAGKENQFEKSKSRYYSYYSTPQKSPEEPQLLTPSRNQKEVKCMFGISTIIN